MGRPTIFKYTFDKLAYTEDFGASARDFLLDMKNIYLAGTTVKEGRTLEAHSITIHRGPQQIIANSTGSNSVTLLSGSVYPIGVTLDSTGNKPGQIHNIYVVSFPVGGESIVLSGANTSFAGNGTVSDYRFITSGSGATCRWNTSSKVWDVQLHGSGSFIAS